MLFSGGMTPVLYVDILSFIFIRHLLPLIGHNNKMPLHPMYPVVMVQSNAIVHHVMMIIGLVSIHVPFRPTYVGLTHVYTYI